MQAYRGLFDLSIGIIFFQNPLDSFWEKLYCLRKVKKFSKESQNYHKIKKKFENQTLYIFIALAVIKQVDHHTKTRQNLQKIEPSHFDELVITSSAFMSSSIKVVIDHCFW